jgi:L-alanine-DL-glutamate epimerase-like enolase superfamily enzyme
LVVVELEDTDGLTGVGTAGFGNPAAIEVVRQLEPLVTGRPAAEVGLVWEVMYRSTLNIGRRGVVVHAISALDIALWDLLGKQLGVPVYTLLGGPVRRSLPVYASWLYGTEDLDALAREAASWVEQGFRGVKQRLPYGPLDGPEGMIKNVELVRTVVQAVGPDVDVMADAYMSWDVGYAIRCIRALEDAGLRLRWIEEPVAPDDVAGLARVRASVSTPVAAGEHEATRYGFRELVSSGAVDVLQPDVNRLGGITEARRVWALGESFGLDVVPHLGFAHNAQLAITSMATPMLEYMPPPASADEADEDQIFWVAFPDEPRADSGRVSLSGRPGLGVTVDRTVLEPVAG